MEAFAIVIPFIVAAGIYAWAKLTPDSLWKNPEEEIAELRGHQQSLCERVARGRREGWDEVMLGQVEERLADVNARLGALVKS
ncbi:hypothetical protein [Oleiharenicola lentus]|uniref:hypothetical protein n=1 Tax=Oleiharenicola lentus TaxID=2508720 RepID=UPI003F672198